MAIVVPLIVASGRLWAWDPSLPSRLPVGRCILGLTPNLYLFPLRIGHFVASVATGKGKAIIETTVDEHWDETGRPNFRNIQVVFVGQVLND
jgi:hypothetical protein